MAKDDLLTALKLYEPELIAIRQDIHRHPEVWIRGNPHCRRTGRRPSACLGIWMLPRESRKPGWSPRSRAASPHQRAIGLRADLDALYIQEVAGGDHGSTVPGKMHACGHDGHTTMLLGAARYLAEHPDEFEAAPSPSSSNRLRKVWAAVARWSRKACSIAFPSIAVYGMLQHAGHSGGRVPHPCIGPFLAASDTWTVVFNGTGGHGERRCPSVDRRTGAATGAVYHGAANYRQP